MIYLLDLFREYRYELLFLAMMGEAVGLPIPAEPTLLVAGALVASGSMHAAIAFPLALAAVLAGDTLIFFLGRSVGTKHSERVIQWYCRWARCTLGSEHCYNRARGLLHRFRVVSLIWVKFIFGARMFTVPLAGISGVGYFRFLAYDGLGAMLWLAFFLGLGYFLDKRLALLDQFLGWAGQGLLAFLVSSLAAVLLYRLYKRRRYRAADVVAASAVAEELHGAPPTGRGVE